jgi:hypothetical protein
MEREFYILTNIFIIFAILFFWTGILSFDIFRENMFMIIQFIYPIVKEIILFIYNCIVWLIITFIDLSNDRKIICIQNMIIVYLIQIFKDD